MKKLFLPLTSLLFLSTLSQAQFTFSGEFRPRTEYAHGYKNLVDKNQNASTATTQRTRLNVLFKNEKINTKLVLHDIRSWGSQAQLVANEDLAVSVHEAWGELFLSGELSLKVGRQEVVYDDSRFFGNVGWAQQARSHDMAILKYNGNVKLHFGLAYNEDTDITTDIFTGGNVYKAMQMLWINKKTDDLNLSFLFVNNGKPVNTVVDGIITDQKTKYSQTFGSHLVYKTGNLGFSTNLYYQTGKDVIGKTAVKDLSAYLVGIDVSYKATDKLKLTGGYELESGTDANELNKNKTFRPFYGTNHKFNGFMDYFNVGADGNQFGLQDIYAKGAYKMDKWALSAHLHFFSTAEKIPNNDKRLGTELDLTAKYAFSKDATIQLGYSQMFAADAMEAIKGGDKDERNNWAYIMITIKPTFFTTKKKS